MTVIDWGKFETYIEDKMMEDQIAGLAVGVSIGGEVIYKRALGALTW